MKKLLALLLLPLGAFALTPIADTVYTASGGTADAGSYLVIRWPRFASSGSHAVPPNVQTVPLANGTFSISLEPTASAKFPFHYTVEYHLMAAGQELPPYTENWDVPDTITPQRIANVLVVAAGPLPAPAAKGDLAASDGVNTVWLPAPATAGYVLLTDPTQPTGLAYASISSLGSNFDTAGAASSAQSNAKTYTDTAIAGLSSVYDQSGAAAAVQAAFQTSLTNVISALNLGTASTHSASDFDSAGAASAAQIAAEAYTDSAVAGAGVTSSYVNNAITNVVANLNLLSASQHAASDFDPAGTATAAVGAIPTASASANGLLSNTDWAVFNGKQAAIPANTYDTYGAAAIAQTNAISTAETNANTAIAALNLKSASQHLSTDFDAAGAASSAVAAIPSSSSSQSKPALITPTDWAAFNGKQNAIPANTYDAYGAATTALTNAISSAQTNTNTAIAALNLKSASQHLATDFDTAGAAASAVTALPALTLKPPYLVSGTNYFIASSGEQVTTLPSSLSLSYLAFTPTTATIIPGPNGDLLIGDPSNAGAYYYGETANNSIEAEFTLGGGANNSGNAGIYVYDPVHSYLWTWTYYASGLNNSISVVTYNGSAAPGTGTGQKSFNSLFQSGVIALKITLVSGKLHFWYSINGGSTWVDYYDSIYTNCTVASAGLIVKGFYSDYYNVVIN